MSFCVPGFEFFIDGLSGTKALPVVMARSIAHFRERRKRCKDWRAYIS
jgi:hypothetical protein